MGQTECAYTRLCVFCQLMCLNLSNNRIHKLDELAELVTKVPHLKTLNLSHNEVKLAVQWILRIITRQELGPFKSSSHTNLFCFCVVVQLKSDRELEKVKGLKLVELWLNRNPLCDLFKDQASYIRSVSDFGG